jgi:hypothetical protein
LPGASVAAPSASEIVQDEIPDHPAPKTKAARVKKDFPRPASMPADPDDFIPF